MEYIGGPIWFYFLLRIIEIAGLILMTVLWLRSMHRSLEACHPISRSMESGLVWLTFIPFFGLVWQFICSKRVGDSLAREYKRRNWSNEEDCPGNEIGVVTGIVVCIITLLRIFFWNQIHDALFFVGTVGIGFCMYRHIDRLGAYRERLEKERDPSLAFGQIPVFQQPVFQQPFQPNPQWPPAQQNPQWQYPPPPQYPPAPQYPPPPFQQPPPPGYAPVPVYQPPVQPPPPQQNPWMPPQYPPQVPVDPNAPPQFPDEYSRWKPKNDPPPGT